MTTEPTEHPNQITQSASLTEFAKAMCEVQKNDLFAKADSENPYYKSMFANLPSVWRTIRKPLTDNGFSIIQTNAAYEGGVAIVTTLLHSSGEWMRGTLTMPSEKRSPQSFGSVMSFERRYALMAIVGVSTADDDDDAEMATDRTDAIPTRKSDVSNLDTSKIHEMPSDKRMLPIGFPDNLADYPIEAQYPIIVKQIDDAKTHWDINGSDVFANGNGYYFSTAPGFTNPPKCVHIAVVSAIMRFGTDTVIKEYPNIKMFEGE